MSDTRTTRKICAGIVTYNPKIDLLCENIAAISHQVDKIILIDNGSDNISDIRNIIVNNDVVDIICNNTNKGIAYALNLIGKYAVDNNLGWFLTLDQDTICPENMIECFLKFIDVENVAVICPWVNLRILGQDRINKPNEKTENVETAISSGCLVNTEIWERIGGFWDDLFIDKVDDDFCYAVRNAGYRILRINSVEIEHEIGNPQVHSLLGRLFYIDSYPAFRYYYIARNNIIVYSLYETKNHSLLRIILTKELKILIGEQNKMDKLRYFHKGIYHGLKWRFRKKKQRNEEIGYNI